ncbi:MAG: ABC transporter permease [Dehalococcoidia bacterium]
MTAFLAMFRKELRFFYRNPMSLGLLLLMPFLLMALISKAFEPLFEGRQTFPVPLVDLDRTSESGRLVSEIDALDGIDVKELVWDDPTLTAGDADSILDDRDYFTLIVIPPGFADRVSAGEAVSVALYSDPAQEAYSGVVRDEVAGQLRVDDLVRTFEDVLTDETGDAEEARTILDEEVTPRVDSPLLTVERLFTEKRKALPGHFEQTVPGFALMFTFWLSVFVAASIQSEKREFFTWKRTLVAPVARSTVLLSRVVAYVLVGLAQMALLFGLGALVFGLSLGEHPYALVPVFAAMALVTTGFGIMMASLVRDFATLNSVVNLAVITMAAAGGALVPLFLLPDWLRTISPAMPHYWAMDACQRVMLLGDGLGAVAPDIAALLAFAAAFFALGLWRFRFVE